MDRTIHSGPSFTAATIRAAMAALDQTKRPPELNSTISRAGVCILLVGTQDPEIVMIERAPNLRVHAGQWGLPGGKVDPGETALRAALREVEEEIGVSLQENSVVGELDPFLTRSGFLMFPFVCVCANDQFLAPNPAEVADVFTLRLSELIEPDRFEQFEVTETRRMSIKMKVNGGYMFAPTAAILYQFREVLLGRLTSVSHFEQPMFTWS